MDSIAPVPNAPPASPAAPGAAAAAPSSDFDTFLRMLTTQIQNQDPLNPIDSADYAVQLATFSGVEQQVRTNELLASLVARSGTGGLADLADWVGRTARVAAPVSFHGTPLTVALAPAASAEQADLIVRDGQGREVDRQGVPLGQDEIEWVPPGPPPAGPLTFHLESRAGGEIVAEARSAVYLPVREVRMEAGAPLVVLAGGDAIPAAAVTALREG